MTTTRTPTFDESRLPSRAPWVRAVITGLAIVSGAWSLSACAPLIVGGAALGGALVAFDRRTSGAQIDDQAIEFKAPRQLGQTLADRGHVNVISYNRIALLTGEVPTEADKAAAEQAVTKIDNVKSVVNELAVMPVASLGSRSNDTVLTTKVKATLLEASDLQSNAVKVITERGIVYLMGRVTEREATRASDLTRSIPGVQRVVRVFEVITEDELKRIGAPAPATSR